MSSSWSASSCIGALNPGFALLPSSAPSESHSGVRCGLGVCVPARSPPAAAAGAACLLPRSPPERVLDRDRLRLRLRPRLGLRCLLRDRLRLTLLLRLRLRLRLRESRLPCRRPLRRPDPCRRRLRDRLSDREYRRRDRLHLSGDRLRLALRLRLRE
ncbi:hypothetical protein H4R23_003203 [Coemansia sp. Cherry 401B]|nr:hypothetical protein IWW52_002933 [Coemansia sp. RSA 2704]KAJ2730907.1 hypothetical protein H4R23_003203 [Coemansia sp. Cherry 401B]